MATSNPEQQLGESHPDQVLYAAGGKLPQLAACEHYAGAEKLLIKSIEQQNRTTPAASRLTGHLFDVTADCEDGAPAGGEAEHAARLAEIIAAEDNRHQRIGARIHDVRHPSWQDELEALIKIAGARLAYLVLPKAESAQDVITQIDYLNSLYSIHAADGEQGADAVTDKPPVHVLIETTGALREVWDIAAIAQVESLDFGLMDFVSAHHGAIPASAMRSPGQFEHALIVQAKCQIASAALANNIIPSHNVTTEFRDLSVVAADARRARQQFGFLRMWSIHPLQIEPIVEAMRPDFAEIEQAADILLRAQEARWGPIQVQGSLHDRASYRYYWELLQRAQLTGATLPSSARERFFNSHIY